MYCIIYSFFNKNNLWSHTLARLSNKIKTDSLNACKTITRMTIRKEKIMKKWECKFKNKVVNSFNELIYNQKLNQYR